MLEMKYLFNLTLRATEGFMVSLFNLLNINLPIPRYTTLARRLRQLNIQFNLPRQKEPIFLAIDSSGLKFFGEGEWKVRVHGYHSTNFI